MTECWKEDPSERPTFSTLIKKFESFSSYAKLPIQFPMNGDKDYPYASDISIKTPVKHHLTPKDPFFPEKRYSYHHDNEYELAGGPTDESDVRRVSSEPILDQAMSPLFTAQGVHRSLSNSYVQMPQREIPQRDILFTRRRSKDEVFTLDIPRVQISASEEM